MVTVKRANVILNIEDDEVDKYCEKGYSVLDQYGNVVKAGAPKEIGALHKLLQDKDIEITALKKELERVKAENEVLVKAAKQSAETVDTTEEVAEEPKKKSSYKRKTAQ